MATIITTTEKSVKIIDSSKGINWNPTKQKVIGQRPFDNGTILITEMGEIDLQYNETTGDGNSFASPEELQSYIEANCFKAAAPAGTGVQSIQSGPGISVDDTDPNNPTISSTASEPTWEQVQDKPEFIAAGATAAAARSAIGLGSASTQATSAFATAAQGTKADSAVQPAAIAGMVESKQEEGKGWPIKNFLPITQSDFDALTVKDPNTSYEIIAQYPTV